MSLQPLHLLASHRDFIYSLSAVGHVVVSGSGDGMALLHDIESGKLLYGLGANQAAVRAIHASPARLVCAGDDGGVSTYVFGDGGGQIAARTASRTGSHAVLCARPLGGASRPPSATTRANGPAGGGAAPAAASRRASAPRRPRAGEEVSSAPSEPPGAPLAAPAQTSAQAYAEKKRLAMERAAKIRAQRAAEQQQRVSSGATAFPADSGDQLDQFMASNPAQPPPMSELDYLHKLGDQKFGRGEGRRR